MDSQGRTSSYPTPRQERIANQETLFGEPLADAIRLTIGYQWNKAGTEIAANVLCRFILCALLWKYSLQDGGEAGEVAIRLPSPSTPPAVARFRSKKTGDGQDPAEGSPVVQAAQ